MQGILCIWDVFPHPGAAFCPKKVLEVSLLGKITPVRPEDCIACGQCEMRCPDFAIFVERRA